LELTLCKDSSTSSLERWSHVVIVHDVPVEYTVLSVVVAQVVVIVASNVVVIVIGHVLIYHAIYKAFYVHLPLSSVVSVTVHHHRRVDQEPLIVGR